MSDPIFDTPDGWPRLLYSRDPHLHQALQKKVRQMGLARYAADRKLAVALVDITEPKHPRVATINAHEMMYVASLPKIAILLAVYVGIVVLFDGLIQEAGSPEEVAAVVTFLMPTACSAGIFPALLADLSGLNEELVEECTFEIENGAEKRKNFRLSYTTDGTPSMGCTWIVIRAKSSSAAGCSIRLCPYTNIVFLN
mgnify:CR=1 FL=1